MFLFLKHFLYSFKIKILTHLINNSKVFLYSLKIEILAHFLKNLFFYIYFYLKREISEKCFIFFQKAILAAHCKKSKVFIYIYQKITYIYLKTGVSKILLHFLDTEISMHSFMYILKKSCVQLLT